MARKSSVADGGNLTLYSTDNTKSGTVSLDSTGAVKLTGSGTNVTIAAGNNLIFAGATATIGGTNSILTIGKTGDSIAFGVGVAGTTTFDAISITNTLTATGTINANNLSSISVPAGNGSKSLYAGPYDYISMRSYNNAMWLRNATGTYTFQSYDDAEDHTRTFHLYVPDPGTSGGDNLIAELGQRTSNATAGSYKGVRIVHYTGSAIVDGYLKAGASDFSNTMNIALGRTASYPTPGTTKGTLHINPTGTNGNSCSITFGSNSGTSIEDRAEAGIYVQGSGSFGTKMYFATTDSHSTGAQARMEIDHAGNVLIGSPTGSDFGYKLYVNGTTFINNTISTPNGLANSTSSNNAYVNVSASGTVISHNLADANPALIVDQVSSSSTGKILDLRAAGSTVASVDRTGVTYFANNLRTDGNFITPLGLMGTGGANNAFIGLSANGAYVSRNVNDANPAFAVNQIHASSTGYIQVWKWQSVNKAYIDINGNLTVNTITETGGADLAEIFLKDEELEPGDVVVKSETGNGFRRSRTASSTLVVGVVSDTYSHLSNGKEKGNGVPVGLAGRVNVKVIGDVRVGDLLVSSRIPGVATSKAHPAAGTVIGKALEAHTGDYISRISMLIMNA
jgi:hypothetical protein